MSKQGVATWYSFLVGEDGKIYEGSGWDRVGAHTLGYNRLGLAASFMGNFMTHTPLTAALDAVKALIQCGIRKGKISRSYALFGHRDVGSTKCPGTAVCHEIPHEWCSQTKTVVTLSVSSKSVPASTFVNFAIFTNKETVSYIRPACKIS
jgi:N-acetylmuramoyl-L-alanine amidase